jgi:hypothetical protein
MKRSAAVIAAMTIASCALASCGAGSAPTAKPMLGTQPYGSVGYGQVKPTRLSLGKFDPICHIHWDSWGGQIALGTGVGFAANPATFKLKPAAVVVYLYDLVTQHGKAAYTKLGIQPVPTKHAGTLKAC